MQSMQTDRLSQPSSLLGGLSPRRFMQVHWQKKPLLIRAAWPAVQPPASRAELFALAGLDDVESRCVEQGAGPQGWKLRHGPFARRSLPALARRGWTLLVQGLNLHSDAAHQMLRSFNFLPQVRLDDLMLSYASDGGGVGPHVDSYDVFLLQVSGRRRWAIAPPDPSAELLPGLPLRILSRFKPQQEWVLEPGDMLYLPPGWGHEGVAVGGDCMTASIGFRAPTAAELVAALTARLTDEVAEAAAEEVAEAAAEVGASWARPPSAGGRRAGRRAMWSQRLADPHLEASACSGLIPAPMEAFALTQMRRLLDDDGALRRALGGWLTEPHPRVWFDAQHGEPDAGVPLRLDRRSRMAYDRDHLYFNGEAYRVAGRDAVLLQRLADQGHLEPADLRRLGRSAREAVLQWWEMGWLKASK